ncbi:MAG: Methyltransferase type 11 [Pedosphaera sp.]|nr:Methyltransferase type 11 [Pedosphaera sp.]
MPVIDFEEVGEHLKAAYRIAARKYRQDDEIEVTTDNHRHLRGILHALSSSFGRPISVLDVGCGTGRYFYCLKNVDSLLGIDISEEMLRIAGNPVRGGDISAKRIELQCRNAHLSSFPSEAFDLIYSLGMFGHGCPVTVELCNKFYEWLAPGGQLFFDALDIATLPLWHRARLGIRSRVYPYLPRRLRNALERRSNGVPLFGLGRKDLERIMEASRFTNFYVTSHVCKSPLWQGIHLECAASKAFMTKQPQWPV